MTTSLDINYINKDKPTPTYSPHNGEENYYIIWEPELKPLISSSEFSRQLLRKHTQQVISKSADGKRKVDKAMFQIWSRMSRTPNSTAKRRLISNTAFYPDKHIGQVHHLFDEIPHRDIFYLDSLLAAHVRSNEANITWVLFQQMHRVRSDLDAYTFTPVLSACSSLLDTRRGRQIHSLITKNGSESETITRTALIDMYSKCNNFNESVQAFEEMKFKDVVAWNAMLSSFLRNGLAREALGVFKAMQREGVEFSGFSLCSVLKACASLKSLHQGKQVHALVIVMGSDLLVLGTALVDFYSSSGLAREAMKVFSQLNGRKDDVIFNSLISGCVQNREYREAFSILSKMRPNIIALTSGLAACSEDLSLSIGKQIHCVAIRFRFQTDTQLSNALLDMYAKCGKISIARTVFDRIPCSDVVSWTSIIDAYRTQGLGDEALELFEKMEKISDVSPNAVTFLAVLSACGHSGLVEKGRECFDRMKEKHGIDPGPEHYACLIDLLGRAELIEDAWSLHSKMGEKGMKVTGAVWAALLNACRVNMDVVRGEIAAKNLFEIEPENPGNYINLSNFYAAIGRWGRVEELRNLMREKGLTKEVGSSWIAIK